MAPRECRSRNVAVYLIGFQLVRLLTREVCHKQDQITVISVSKMKHHDFPSFKRDDYIIVQIFDSKVKSNESRKRIRIINNN